MQTMPGRFTQSRAFAKQGRGLWLLALLLVVSFSQFLGQLHAVEHSHSSEHLASARDVHGQAPGTRAPAGFLEHLFDSHEEDSADCHLYDQSSHCDAMPGFAAVVLPLVLSSFTFSVLAGLAVARWHALFQARGPPLIR